MSLGQSPTLDTKQNILSQSLGHHHQLEMSDGFSQPKGGSPLRHTLKPEHSYDKSHQKMFGLNLRSTLPSSLKLDPTHDKSQNDHHVPATLGKSFELDGGNRKILKKESETDLVPDKAKNKSNIRHDDNVKKSTEEGLELGDPVNICTVCLLWFNGSRVILGVKFCIVFLSLQ